MISYGFGRRTYSLIGVPMDLVGAPILLIGVPILLVGGPTVLVGDPIVLVSVVQLFFSSRQSDFYFLLPIYVLSSVLFFDVRERVLQQCMSAFFANKKI